MRQAASMRVFLIPLAALVTTGCACAPSTGCKSISRVKAIELARKQKRDMLSRSTDTERINFVSDDVVPAEGAGFADVVGFKGRTGEPSSR